MAAYVDFKVQLNFMKTRLTKMRLLFLNSNFRGDFDKKLVRFSPGKGEREEREMLAFFGVPLSF